MVDGEQVDHMTDVLRRVIDRKSVGLDPDSRADRIIAVCFQHNLFATRDDYQGRVLVGTLDRYLGSVEVNDDWDRINQEILAMSMEETWG